MHVLFTGSHQLNSQKYKHSYKTMFQKYCPTLLWPRVCFQSAAQPTKCWAHNAYAVPPHLLQSHSSWIRALTFCLTSARPRTRRKKTLGARSDCDSPRRSSEGQSVEEWEAISSQCAIRLLIMTVLSSAPCNITCGMEKQWRWSVTQWIWTANYFNTVSQRVINSTQTAVGTKVHVCN